MYGVNPRLPQHDPVDRFPHADVVDIVFKVSPAHSSRSSRISQVQPLNHRRFQGLEGTLNIYPVTCPSSTFFKLRPCGRQNSLIPSGRHGPQSPGLRKHTAFKKEGSLFGEVQLFFNKAYIMSL